MTAFQEQKELGGREKYLIYVPWSRISSFLQSAAAFVGVFSSFQRQISEIQTLNILGIQRT